MEYISRYSRDTLNRLCDFILMLENIKRDRSFIFIENTGMDLIDQECFPKIENVDDYNVINEKFNDLFIGKNKNILICITDKFKKCIYFYLKNKFISYSYIPNTETSNSNNCEDIFDILNKQTITFIKKNSFSSEGTFIEIRFKTSDLLADTTKFYKCIVGGNTTFVLQIQNKNGTALSRYHYTQDDIDYVLEQDIPFELKIKILEGINND